MDTEKGRQLRLLEAVLVTEDIRYHLPSTRGQTVQFRMPFKATKVLEGINHLAAAN